MDWKKIKDGWLADPDALQLLTVECTGGSNAKVRYYNKENGAWRLLHRGSAFIGKNGLGKTREGDAKTPEGDLRPLFAFGIKPNPGSPLPYLDVSPGVIAADGEGPFYNRVVGPLEYGAAEPEGERMWELSPEYDYGLQTDFNSSCIYPLGSAIFVHCKGAKTWTGGCIALDKRLMLQILKTAGYGLRISIH